MKKIIQFKIEANASGELPYSSENLQLAKSMSCDPDNIKIKKIKAASTQLDRIESQVTYTAIETDTLSTMLQPMTLPADEEITAKSPKEELLENISKWVELDLWTAPMLENAKLKGIITEEEFISLTEG